MGAAGFLTTEAVEYLSARAADALRDPVRSAAGSAAVAWGDLADAEAVHRLCREHLALRQAVARLEAAAAEAVRILSR